MSTTSVGRGGEARADSRRDSVVFAGIRYAGWGEWTKAIERGKAKDCIDKGRFKEFINSPFGRSVEVYR